MRHAFYAQGRKRQGEMNKLEAKYAQHLDGLKLQGEIQWWGFEVMKFILAPKTSYTPDFAVLMKNGEMQMHECKGFMMEDANVKIKVAAEKFPFRFFVIKLKSHQWEIKEV